MRFNKADITAFVFFTFMIGLGMLVVYNSIKTNPTTGDKLNVRIDKETGCEYLESYQGHLIPRFNSHGVQICNPALAPKMPLRSLL